MTNVARQQGSSVSRLATEVNIPPTFPRRPLLPGSDLLSVLATFQRKYKLCPAEWTSESGEIILGDWRKDKVVRLRPQKEEDITVERLI